MVLSFKIQSIGCKGRRTNINPPKATRGLQQKGRKDKYAMGNVISGATADGKTCPAAAQGTSANTPRGHTTAPSRSQNNVPFQRG